MITTTTQSTVFLKERKISLLVLDVDGTLYDSTSRLPLENIEAVKKAQAAGLKIALASGRPRIALKMVLDRLDLTTPDISSGGAHIVDPITGKDLYYRTITRADTEKAVRIGREFGSTIFIDSPSIIIGEGDKKIIQGIAAKNEYMDILTSNDVLADTDFEPTKVVNFCHGRYEDMKSAVVSRMNGTISVTDADPNALEINPLGVSKGSAVKFLANYLGIPMDEVMVVGDAPNDFSMFAVAGISVAMGNAIPAVKAAAHLVAPRNDDNGVAWVINQIS